MIVQADHDVFDRASRRGCGEPRGPRQGSCVRRAGTVARRRARGARRGGAAGRRGRGGGRPRPRRRQRALRGRGGVGPGRARRRARGDIRAGRRDARRADRLARPRARRDRARGRACRLDAPAPRAGRGGRDCGDDRGVSRPAARSRRRSASASSLPASYAALALRAFAGGAHGAGDALARPALELVGRGARRGARRVAHRGRARPGGGDDRRRARRPALGGRRRTAAPADRLARPRRRRRCRRPRGSSRRRRSTSAARCGRSPRSACLRRAASRRRCRSASRPSVCCSCSSRPDDAPDAVQIARLTTFGVRVAHALRSSARARTLGLELDRTRALLAVVGQATAELSLAHTLETAVERLSRALRRRARRGVPARSRQPAHRLRLAAALAGPHARVAERLLEVALGTGRGRPVVEVADAWTDDRLREARDAARESGIDAALAVPLLVRDEVIGLLAVYPQRGRRPTENEASLLAALAGQLAVAVQNAQLHEQTEELEHAARVGARVGAEASSACARSTRSRARSRRASRSRRRSRRSRSRRSTCSTSMPRCSACPTRAASIWCRARCT